MITVPQDLARALLAKGIDKMHWEVLDDGFKLTPWEGKESQELPAWLREDDAEG
jgi:hypothetical protein